MSVNPEILRALMASGATSEMIVAVVEAAYREEQAALAAKRAKAADVKKRQREQLRRDDSVHLSPPKSIGLDGTKVDTGGLSPSPIKENPHTPKKITPTRTSLRSEEVSARTAAWLRFREAYPKKSGHAWQPAEEKFYRWIKAGIDPEAMIVGASAYAASRAGEDPQFTKAPVVFLNQQCWKDEHTPNLFRPANGARYGPEPKSEKRNPYFAAMQRDLLQ